MSTKILIVDDEADVRVFLGAVLKKAGYEVISATNGVEGLELAKLEKPALVVLDLVMPKQSGSDFHRSLAEDPELAQTPIIVVSGLAGRQAAVDRAVAVFDKPPNPSEFIAAVKKALA